MPNCIFPFQSPVYILKKKKKIAACETFIMGSLSLAVLESGCEDVAGACEESSGL